MILKCFRVAGTDLLAQGNLFVAEVCKFGLYDGGLQAITAAVGAQDIVRLALFAAMIGHSAEGFAQLRIGGEDSATIAISAEWFSGEKASAGDSADRAALASVLFRSEALSGVFDNLEAMFFGNRFEGGVVSHLAE